MNPGTDYQLWVQTGYNEFLYLIDTLSYPIKVNNNTIEFIMHIFFTAYRTYSVLRESYGSASEKPSEREWHVLYISTSVWVLRTGRNLCF